MAEMIDAYDTALFDLDGVVYLGPDSIAGAAEGIAGLHERGKKVGFITNNAARRPDTVVKHLVSLGIPATENEVLTSSQAGARMMTKYLEPGSKVLIVGTEALAHEVELVGFKVVPTAYDEPDAVIQGYDPDLAWSSVIEACAAIQAGAQWFGTNLDPTRPTERGLVPAAGAQIDAIRKCVPVAPITAGKPERPMLDEAVRRWDARKPIFVGDRIDTDIIGAVNAEMDSLLVFTGSHGKLDLLLTSEGERPTFIGADLRALLEEPRVAEIASETVTCRETRATIAGDEIVVHVPGSGLEAQLDGLWAVANLAWQHPGLSWTAALDALDLVHPGIGE